MLLGSYPFPNLNIYETIPAMQILADSIKQQLVSTLRCNFVDDEEILTFYSGRLQKQINITPGPIPNTTPGDLFILIAGLLHPNPELRLSVTECCGCPFLGIVSEQSEEYVSVDEIYKQKQTYSDVKETLDGIETIRIKSMKNIASTQSIKNGYQDFLVNENRTSIDLKRVPLTEQ